ncbi:MAG TPA: SemiSWEET family transporter [Kofleriaceae bacterium]|nr:SemiSWEET family transporter [Kofleriaceae bacterium]
MQLTIGLIAATLTIASFVAQVYKVLRTRDVKGLSAPMWAMSLIAFGLWVAYGVMLEAWPLVIPNAICFMLSGFILALKLMPRRKLDAIADVATQKH